MLAALALVRLTAGVPAVGPIDNTLDNALDAKQVKEQYSETLRARCPSGMDASGHYDIPRRYEKFIDSYQYINCPELKSVSIPYNVERIGSWAFFNTGLTTVRIPSRTTSISGGAFEGCPNLQSVIIDDNAPHHRSDLYSIGPGAFKNCYNLTSIKIPASVTFIHEDAFVGTGITDVCVPNLNAYIYPHAFIAGVVPVLGACPSPPPPPLPPSSPPPPPALVEVALDPSGPLNLCEGDCDNDAQCAGGLKCFQRSGYTDVPGCAGRGTADWDYCIVPPPDMCHCTGSGNQISCSSTGIRYCASWQRCVLSSNQYVLFGDWGTICH